MSIPEDVRPANTTSRGCIIAGLIVGGACLLAAVALIIATSLGSKDASEVRRASSSPASPSSLPDEPPLTPAQDRWLGDVLKETDKLDILYRNKVSDARRYFEAGSKMEAKYFEGEELLPKSDTRAILLINTVKAYQEAVALITTNEMGQSSESPDSLIAVAGLRKALLKKVRGGRLTPDEKKLVDDLRREWQKN
jgi:hypothetical protein